MRSAGDSANHEAGTGPERGTENRLRSMQCHIRVPVRVRPLQWPLQKTDSIDKDRKTKHSYDNAKYIAGFHVYISSGERSG